MITLLGILFLLLIIWSTIKILPAIIGVSFTIFLTLIQIIGIILLLPLVGVLCFMIDAIVIWLIIIIVKAIA